MKKLISSLTATVRRRARSGSRYSEKSSLLLGRTVSISARSRTRGSTVRPESCFGERKNSWRLVRVGLNSAPVIAAKPSINSSSGMAGSISSPLSSLFALKVIIKRSAALIIPWDSTCNNDWRGFGSPIRRSPESPSATLAPGRFASSNPTIATSLKGTFGNALSPHTTIPPRPKTLGEVEEVSTPRHNSWNSTKLSSMVSGNSFNHSRNFSSSRSKLLSVSVEGRSSFIQSSSSASQEARSLVTRSVRKWDSLSNR